MLLQSDKAYKNHGIRRLTKNTLKTTVFTLFAVLGRDRAGYVDFVPPSLHSIVNRLNTVFFYSLFCMPLPKKPTQTTVFAVAAIAA